MSATPEQGPPPLREAPKQPPLHPYEKPETVEDAEEEPATNSHALANAEPEDILEKGAAQLGHDATEVRDLGWNEKPDGVPSPLVGGLPNEELWTLIRRFNKASLALRSKGTVK